VQREFDETRQKLDGQHQSYTSGSQDPAKQAAQLRSLEHGARKWAKKFLHKVKAAAAAAEHSAGLPTAPSHSAPPTASRQPAPSSSFASRGTTDVPSRLPTRTSLPSSPPDLYPCTQAHRIEIMDSIASEEPRQMEELRATAESMRAGSSLPHPNGVYNGRNGSLAMRETPSLDPDVFGTLDTRASEDMRTFGDLGASGSLPGKHKKGRTIFNRLFSHKGR
jgi:hypothetical protein